MLELNFWPSTAMLWPEPSVAVASPWQARQSAWARRAIGAKAKARTAMAAARIPLRRFDRAYFRAARFILPSSFPRQKRIDPRLSLVSYIQNRCGWGIKENAEATLQRCAFEGEAGSDRCHKRGDMDHTQVSVIGSQRSVVRRPG